MAYTLGNKCAKNLCKRILLLQLIIENVVTCFFWNTVYIIFIITPKQQTVDKITQYNTTQHNHHKSRKELIYTVINQIKI